MIEASTEPELAATWRIMVFMSRRCSFRRSMSLPQGTDESSINARFHDGVLEVRVAGAAAVQEPKRIQIEGNGAGS